MSRKIDMEKFILGWCRTHFSADALNTEFHEAFRGRFGGRYDPKAFGSQKNHKSQRLLADMARRGLLKVHRIGINPWLGPGWPKWVRTYTLPEREKK